jgi:hypothetical protein
MIALVGPLAAVIVPIRAVAQVVIDLTMGAIGLMVARKNAVGTANMPA